MDKIQMKIDDSIREQLRCGFKVGGVFAIECIGSDGEKKWEDILENNVVNEGLQHLLDILFHSTESGVATIDPWYVGLTGTAPAPASDGSDTLASHSGWTEFSAYSEGARQEYIGTRTNQTESNTGSKAAFSINADSQTVGGAFLCSASTGTSGTLLCVAAFSGGDKSVDSGDTLNVTYTFSAADDGA